MKQFLSVICILVLTIFGSSQLKAVGESSTGASSGGKFEKIGVGGAQFLKIGVGARGVAMGGAYTSVANDLSSVFWNPAGIAEVKTIGAEFSYTQWFLDFSHNCFVASMPLNDNFKLAFNMVSFGATGIEVTTIDRPDGTGAKYDIADRALGMTFAGYLTDQFSFGVTAKYVNQAFSSLSSNGFAFDIGTTYKTGIQGINIGFALCNLGTDQSYEGNDLKSKKKLFEELYAAPLEITNIAAPHTMPLSFRAGISSELYKEEDHNLTAAADFVTYSDVPEQFAFGAEYTWRKLLSIRAGYSTGNEQMGFSAGLGLNYDAGAFAGKIDYAMSPSSSLGLINRITVAINMQ